MGWEESKWKENMELVPPHRYIKNTSTNGTVLTEQLLNISGRLWKLKRTRKIPSQLGRMKERKKEKRNQGGINTSGGKLKVRRSSHTQKTPLTAGKSAGTERDLWGIRRESSKQSVKGRTK